MRSMLVAENRSRAGDSLFPASALRVPWDSVRVGAFPGALRVPLPVRGRLAPRRHTQLPRTGLLGLSV